MRKSLVYERGRKPAIIEPGPAPGGDTKPRGVTTAAFGAVLIGLLLLISGCSTLRIGYGQGSTLGLWWLDRYVDFSPEQRPQARAAVEQWFAWHRRSQLAEDASLLEQAARESLQDATAAQACRWVGVLERKRDLYVAQAATAVAEIGATLSAEQLQHMERRFAKNSADWRDEFAQADPQERDEEAVARVEDRAEMLYGALERSQRQFIAEQVKRSPWEPERWLSERQADQRDLLLLLRQLGQGGQAPDQRVQMARTSLQRLLQPGNEALRQYREQLYQHQCRFTADLHNRMTPTQRKHAADKLSGWARDLRSFAP
jgi:hypothetical protein